MGLNEDLAPDDVAEALPGRPARTYPAILSTEADALAWARAGGPHGAVVVADYQVSPRGRGGIEWSVAPGRSLAFSLILRPTFPPRREGWLYTVAASALADVLGGGASIEWPDQVHVDGKPAGAVGAQAGLEPDRIEWAVISVLVREAPPPRAALLADVVRAIERRYDMSAEKVVADYLPRCATIGRSVRARLIPLGPAGPEVAGKAVTTIVDGSLVLETAEDRRVAVPPQNLGILEDAPAGDGASG